jgi:plasmid stabilization system protein ParE
MSPKAYDDLEEIKDYIARDIFKSIDGLKKHPNLGVSLQAKTGIITDYRYLIHKPYLIFYKNNEKFINIYRVLHGARDYLKVLGLE